MGLMLQWDNSKNTKKNTSKENGLNLAWGFWNNIIGPWIYILSGGGGFKPRTSPLETSGSASWPFLFIYLYISRKCQLT